MKQDFDKVLKDESYGIHPAPIEAEYALRVLCDYLLGEDWYVVDPLGPKQVNTCIVHEILRKYSKEYKKDFKKLQKESIHRGKQ